MWRSPILFLERFSGGQSTPCGRESTTGGRLSHPIRRSGLPSLPSGFPRRRSSQLSLEAQFLEGSSRDAVQFAIFTAAQHRIISQVQGQRCLSSLVVIMKPILRFLASLGLSIAFGQKARQMTTMNGKCSHIGPNLIHAVIL